jgi:hypothetical protein
LLSGGRKSRVILALSVAKKLIGLLEKVPTIETSGKSKFYALSSYPLLEYPKTLGRLTSGKRVYFVDLKNNEHGSFVRLTQTLSRVPKRFSIFVPVEGIQELCKLLTQLTDEFGDVDEKGKNIWLVIRCAFPHFRGSVAAVTAVARCP